MRPMKVLFISGSLGLGHAARDLAIAAELRRLDSSVDIVWLAAEPATTMLRSAGETVLPEAREWAQETAVAESVASGYSSSVFRYVVKAYDGMDRNAAVFERVTSREQFDLVVGDETYELWEPLAKKPARLGCPFVMIYDFVGFDPGAAGLSNDWARTTSTGCGSAPTAGSSQTDGISRSSSESPRTFPMRASDRSCPIDGRTRLTTTGSRGMSYLSTRVTRRSGRASQQTRLWRRPHDSGGDWRNRNRQTTARPVCTVVPADPAERAGRADAHGLRTQSRAGICPSPAQHGRHRRRRGSHPACTNTSPHATSR